MPKQPGIPPNQRMLRARLLVAVTFPLAFLAHDLEEVLTAGHWQRTGTAALRRRFPRAPQRLIDMALPSPRQMTIAVGVVGLSVLSTTGTALIDLASAREQAAAGAAAPAGEMRLLRVALAAFTAHGVTHLASAAALRSYTPGVVTVPLVIAPYSLWAWRTLWASGLRPDPRELAGTVAAGAAVAFPLVVGAQLLGRALSRGR
ncbi:MAG TPA: HXXEE domain-containing protein [Nakamurella sp.]|nr:HXXEE domain-containing protein [Nakamurella sp.]